MSDPSSDVPRFRRRSVKNSIEVDAVAKAAGVIVNLRDEEQGFELSKMARDITEHKRSEAQIVNLAHEAEHRTKNILSTQFYHELPVLSGDRPKLKSNEAFGTGHNFRIDGPKASI